MGGGHGPAREGDPRARANILAVAFHPGGAMLAALHGSAGATVFDAATGAVVARLRLAARHDTKGRSLTARMAAGWLASAPMTRPSACSMCTRTSRRPSSPGTRGGSAP